jgi:hypothetical protein
VVFVLVPLPKQASNIEHEEFGSVVWPLSTTIRIEKMLIYLSGDKNNRRLKKDCDDITLR